MVGTTERRHREEQLREFRDIEKLALKECHQRQDNEDQVTQIIFLFTFLSVLGASQWL